MKKHRWLALLAVWSQGFCVAGAVSLEQIISREDPAFNCSRTFLSVGRDGMVYMCCGGNPCYVLRMNRDGSEKVGAPLQPEAASNATANRDGIIASANGHFAHKVAIYRKDFVQYAEATDFLVSDAVGWNAPCHVEAGASGDFYACDMHRSNRILRINPAGKVVRIYTVPAELSANNEIVTDFRVSEKTEAFYLAARNHPLYCVDFSGTTRWTLDAGVGWFGEGPRSGGFDVDDNGILYVITREGDIVRKFSVDGQPAGEIKLQMGQFKPGNGRSNSGMYVFGQDIIVQPTQSKTELFQCYDLGTGALKKAVSIDFEKLTVTYPTEIWTAGEPVPFEIDFDSGMRTVRPAWHVWARPVGALAYREFPLSNGRLLVPDDCAGLYQIKVTPEAQPWQRGQVSEYLVRGVVEIRQPNTHGSATVVTPAGRVSYGRGEEIAFSVVVRSAGAWPGSMTVCLMEGERVLAESTVPVNAGVREHQFSLDKSFTAGLRPGHYLLTVLANGLTGVPQPLVIGPGIKPSNNFYTIQYNEGFNFPPANVWDAPDVSAQTVHKYHQLGMTMMIDRLGIDIPTWLTGVVARDKNEVKEIVARLNDDPQAVAPEKALPGTNYAQTLAGYSAHGIRQMAVLTGMDAGVHFGTGLWPKTKDQALSEVKLITEALQPYPAFRGWIWAVNWWIYDGRRQDAAKTPDQKTAFLNALKQANDTGRWDPVLDQVADHWLGYAPDSQKTLGDHLHATAPESGLVTSVAGCSRNPDCYPPTTFSNVDEVDLYVQWEQMAPPYFSPFSVDFYKRPGKPAWGHPEVWNDSGNGDQILPTLFSMIMRGVDGVGNADGPTGWPQPDDPRSSALGMNSVYRSLNALLRQYGPWLNTLTANDRVAIVVSSRMMKLDDWSTCFGKHLARLLEGYVSCLHAHRPASLVFSEDLKLDSLKNFKAVLIIGQRYEIEPNLSQALQEAKAAGVPIFYDGSCRSELVKEGIALGVAFNHFEKVSHPVGNDFAYWDFRQICLENLPALEKAFSGIATVARIDNPEVFASERVSGDGQYLFLVNNTTPLIDPGQLWRVGLVVSSRVPVMTPVGIGSAGKAVYDIFALKQVSPRGGEIQADLRSLPFRIFAVLPSGVGQIELFGPEAVAAGQPFHWKIRVLDRSGNALRTTVPLRIRLLDAENSVLDEHYTVFGPKGTTGTMTACLNPKSNQQVLEATELFSGKTASLPLTVSWPSQPTPIRTGSPAAQAEPKPARRKISGKNPGKLAPAEKSFGPHVRDMIVLDNRTAVLSALNWDNNLYGVDAASGELSWKRKIGHAFAYLPKRTDQGFAVQGFDFGSAGGYQLFLVGPDGRPRRRFELYGTPRRATQRFVPYILNDQMNHFAVPPNGEWVAASGDLGLAVWDKNGKLLWTEDWWKTNRNAPRVTETQNFADTRLVTPFLAALDNQTLLVCDGLKVSAQSTANGKTRWQLDLAPSGEVTKIIIGPDNKTAYLLATTYGGRVYVVRNGKLIHTLVAGGTDLAIEASGSLVTVVNGQVLKLYSLSNGLQWTFTGDGVMFFPRFSPDGKRMVATTDLGSVYVLDLDGKVLFEDDLGATTVPAWMPNGDLILGTWMGRVCRLDARYARVWDTNLVPEVIDRDKVVVDDSTPASGVEGWTNAAPAPLPLIPNLLGKDPLYVKFCVRNDYQDLTQDANRLFDGKPEPPEEPWIDWGVISWLGEGSAFNSLLLDTYRTQLQVTGITFVEDPAHPESWLRDAYFQYWDAANEQWVDVQPLLSNAPVHSHLFAKPVESSRFRILMPPGLVGNLRLAEIVFHGQNLGNSHPDVLARKPVAVVFDESGEADFKKHLTGWGTTVSFDYGNPYSGKRCLMIKGDAAQPCTAPFCEEMPNFDFDIAKDPGPGQYRYIRFAWKTAAPETKGMCLRMGGVALFASAGDFWSGESVTPCKVSSSLPTEWRVETVDLWEIFKQPARLRSLSFRTLGGPWEIDQILLGRTRADLENIGKE